MIFILFSLALLGTGFAMQCPNVTTPDQMPPLDSKQFSYIVEITVEDLQQTFNGYEFYDNEHQTIVLYVEQTIGSDHMFDQKKIVYDFQYNQTFVVERNNGSNGDCTIHDLDPTMPHEPSLFGVGVENGPLDVKNAFYWSGNHNATLLDNTTFVEGILTDHYQTCLNFDGGNWTYLIDVYFSASNWTMPAGQQAPLRLTLNATDDKNASYYYTYKFTDYHTSEYPRLRSPSKPYDMICPGRKDAPPLQAFTNQFSFESELHLKLHGSNIITHSSEWYDYDNKMFRMDFTNQMNGTYTEIHDYNQGVTYRIQQSLGRCGITPISVNSSFIDAEFADNSTTLVRLRSPSDFSRLFNLTFGGFREYSGVPAVVWIGQDPVETADVLYNGEMAFIQETFYFSKDKWSGVNQLLGISQKYVSVINATHNITTMLDGQTFNYLTSVSMSSFDISPCFNNTMRQKFVLKFPSDYQSSVDANRAGFRDGFVAAVAKHANVSQIRVKFEGESSYLSAPDKKNDVESHGSGGIFVWATLLAKPNVQGDSVNMIQENNLPDALAALQKAVSGNEFEVMFTTSATGDVTMTAFPDSWMTEEDLLYPDTHTPVQTGVKTGVVAGVAIALAVVGFILGYLARGCRAKRSGVEYAGLI